jgi:hypothetical protein
MKDELLITKESMPIDDHRNWICWACKAGKAKCFICKKYDKIKPKEKRMVPEPIVRSGGKEGDDPQHISENVDKERPYREGEEDKSNQVSKKQEGEDNSEFKFVFETYVIKCFMNS